MHIISQGSCQSGCYQSGRQVVPDSTNRIFQLAEKTFLIFKLRFSAHQFQNILQQEKLKELQRNLA